MTYTHSIRVRYGECDMQKVVFNANYWVYCDDAIDHWMRTALGRFTSESERAVEITDLGFDFMLKACNGIWFRGVRFGETVDLVCSVSRWGNTSFDVKVDMQVEGRTCFEATIVYVSVGVESREPSAVPDFVKAALGGPA